MRSGMAAVVLLAAACGGGGSGDTDAPPGSGDGPGSNDVDAPAGGCDPGKVDVGAGCVTINPNDPAQRTNAEVCARWATDHVVTDANPFSRATANDCDAGTLSAGGHADTLKRMNLFRWLSGLTPTTLSASLDPQQQQCADLESWWDFSLPNSPHQPPNTVKCYTASAAAGAGSSNIAWGNGPAASIDQFIEDNGNATTLGHRRWIVNPPLSGVGVGYWQGGGMYGSAECLSVFGSSGTGPNPTWVTVPNPGVSPLPIATWTWSFSSNLGGTVNATVAIKRLGDGATLAVTMMPLSQGYGQNTISWKPSGWTPAAGETYRVTISGVTGGDIVYAVKPITCT